MREEGINSQAKEIKVKESVKKDVMKTEILGIKKVLKKRLEDKITKNISNLKNIKVMKAKKSYRKKRENSGGKIKSEVRSTYNITRGT